MHDTERQGTDSAATGAAPLRREIAHARGTQSVLEWAGPGPGAPVLHFAHANGFHAGTYRTLLGPLAGQARIVASDMRGHGQTSLPANPADLKTWVTYRDDLIALLDALDAGPYVLAGHSMGGTTSVLVAKARPDLVTALVLLDPVVIARRIFRIHGLMRSLGMTPPEPPIAKGAANRRAVFPDRATMVEKYTGRGAFTTWPPAFLRDYVEEGVRDQEDGTITLACAPAWEAASFCASSGHDIWPGLGGIKCPVTLMRGTVFSTCPETQARALLKRLPRTEDRVIEGASHFLPMEHADEVRAALAAALT